MSKQAGPHPRSKGQALASRAGKIMMVGVTAQPLTRSTSKYSNDKGETDLFGLWHQVPGCEFSWSMCGVMRASWWWWGWWGDVRSNNPCLKIGQIVEEVSHVHASRDVEVSIVFMGFPEMFVALRGLGLTRFDRLTSNPSLPLLRNCRAQATKMMAQWFTVPCPIAFREQNRCKGCSKAAEAGWLDNAWYGGSYGKYCPESMGTETKNQPKGRLKSFSAHMDTTWYCQDMTNILRSDASGSIASSSWETCRDAP